MAGVPPGSSISLNHHRLLALSLLALSVGGCGDTIALGSECPPFGDQCIDPMPRDRIGDGADAAWPGSPAADASVPNAPRPEVVDAGSDTGPGLFPEFQNPSFDITAGSRTGGLISTFAVQSSPWLSCSPPGRGPGVYPQADLRANLPVGEPDKVLPPTEGMSLVNASPDGTSIAQTLRAPLVAGQPYAFVVDLAATENSTDLALVLQGGSVCFGTETLTVSPPVSAGAWSSVCMRFTPMRAYSSLMLSVSSAAAATGTRLFIDNIRPDPSCL